MESVKPEFIKEIQGQKFARFAGLLDAAHRSGLKSIKTKMIQMPSEQNGRVALFSAKVVMGADGADNLEDRTFTGWGEAAPNNVSPAMALCLPRMAETRAKARALRDAVNFAGVALEELYNPDNPEEKGPSEQYDRRAYENASNSRTSARTATSTVKPGNTPHANAQARTATAGAATEAKPAEAKPATAQTLAAATEVAIAAGKVEALSAEKLAELEAQKEEAKAAREMFKDAALMSGIGEGVLRNASSLKQLLIVIEPKMKDKKLSDLTAAYWRALKVKLNAYLKIEGNEPLPGTPAWEALEQARIDLEAENAQQTEQQTTTVDPAENDRAATIAAMSR